MPGGLRGARSALGFGVPRRAVRLSLLSNSVLAWSGRDSAAEGDRGHRTEHYREHHPEHSYIYIPEHHPLPSERQHSAQVDVEAE